MLEEEGKKCIGWKMAKPFNQGSGFVPPTSGLIPPKFGHYYRCKKCGHGFEGLLPICPKCKSLNVGYDIACH
ncbi:hypothetical protein FACS1894147_03410 [Spirochaetia bacterium]|nr:hypothetical protein FACS1894147_03410 [Spirochaetia bacterium]